jgi:glutamate N-acetyltransferase/amino-acid N-acetyltransferase
VRTPADPGYGEFLEGLTYVCRYLAQMIARDGEGATKFIEVRVEGARTQNDARLAARSIAGSSLVKAAVYGKDANWGRILCALGYSGADFDPELVDMYLGDLQMMARGKALVFDEDEARAYLEGDEILAVVKLSQGGETAVAWGCDLTHDYVSINADYRS